MADDGKRSTQSDGRCISIVFRERGGRSPRREEMVAKSP